MNILYCYTTHHVKNNFFFIKYLSFEVSCLIQTRGNTEEYYLAVRGIRNIGYDPNPSGINLNTAIFQ